MNAIIKLIEKKGLSGQFRDACIVLGALVILVICFWYGSKLGLTRRQRLISILIAYPFLIGILELITMVSKYLASINFLGVSTTIYSGVKVFAFLPVISVIVSKILKIEWIKIADLFAVIRLAEYPVSSLGCLFVGCCRGYVCDWGIYSPIIEQNYFPVQILNAVIMLAIIIFLLYRAKKCDYEADGKQLPIMLCLFGMTRIVTEFLMDNEKVFWGLSTIAIHCIIMMIVGVSTLGVIRRSEKLQTTMRSEIVGEEQP